MSDRGLTRGDIDTAAWHSARMDVDVSNLLNSNAFDVIGWRDHPDLLLIRKPTKDDLHKRQGWGTRFWLIRFALAAHLGIDPEARTSAAAARAWGANWEDVGNTVGLSRQGAQQRYKLKPA